MLYTHLLSHIFHIGCCFSSGPGCVVEDEDGDDGLASMLSTGDVELAVCASIWACLGYTATSNVQRGVESQPPHRRVLREFAVELNAWA